MMTIKRAVALVLSMVVWAGGAVSSAEARTRSPRISTLSGFDMTHSADVASTQRSARIMRLTGKLPHLVKRSTIDVSASFDESTVNSEHPCAIANTVPESFSSEPWPFNTTATVVITHFMTGDVIDGTITGGHKCAIEPIDGCPVEEIGLDFAFSSGSGQFANAKGRGTVHLVIGKCVGVVEFNVYHNELVLWEISN